LKKNSLTEAGPSSPPPNDARIDAINQIFALFKRNYHNQFFKAFSNETDVNTAKRLWMESLQRFEPQLMLKGARAIIENNEFLPTLATMIKACETCSKLGLPEAHAAYLEACRAPSPKASYKWSHLAVYYAGRASDWYFLQNNNEYIAFPIFKQHYQTICDSVRLGEKLPSPQQLTLPEKTQSPIDKKKARRKFSKLRSELDL